MVKQRQDRRTRLQVLCLPEQARRFNEVTLLDEGPASFNEFCRSLVALSFFFELCHALAQPLHCFLCTGIFGCYCERPVECCCRLVPETLLFESSCVVDALLENLLLATQQGEPRPLNLECEVTANQWLCLRRQEWRPVLCETNTTRDLVLQIQRGLKAAGFDPGSIDGVLGRDTITAADAYQRKHNLPTGGMTIQTIEKLGIKIGDQG